MNVFGQAQIKKLDAQPIVAFLTLALAILAAWAVVTPEYASAYTGITKFDLDVSTSQAGGHPDIEIDLEFDTTKRKNGEFVTPAPNTCNCDEAKAIDFHFPTGFIGNPHVVTRCEMDAFVLNKCPPESQVGIVQVNIGEIHVPLINLEPHANEAGLLGYYIPLLDVPQFQVLGARTGSDYGLDSLGSSIYHPVSGISDVELIIWGVPAAESNDVHRFPPGITQCKKRYPGVCAPPYPSSIPPEPYLQNPTQCETPLSASVDLTYYSNITETAERPWPTPTGCDLLSFNPSLSGLPTTKQADTPSGLDVEIKVPQTQSPTVPTPSQLRSTKITLPEGFAINPGASDGKSVCTDSEARLGTEEAAQCPEHSKVGTARLDSSALPGPIDGGIYLGAPKPGDPYPILLTASGHATNVKLRGSTEVDPVTGQILTNFPDLPQSPFSEFDLHFFGSERGLFVTPSRCGTYPVKTEFVPWNSALGNQESTSFFEIDSGPGGKPCPGTNRPFSPRLSAGAEDNTAAAQSPMAFLFNRDDGDQLIRDISVEMPPGFTASLKGIPYCPEASLAGVESKTGRAEQASPSCPASSQVGTVTSAQGAGTHPIHTPGKVYLAGPYNGAPISLAFVIPGIGGPYDLGNVLTRLAVNVDPITAEVTTVADPLPKILEGIPLKIRSVQIDLDRPSFTRNPTNCDPFSIASTIFGDEGARANPSPHFQVANCASLPFAPKLALRLTGKMKRTGHPSLKATLNASQGEANIAETVVTLPKTAILDNGSIGNVCTRVQFAADACPANSVYGTATARTPLLDEPLSGPVYLRSSSNKVPDLVADLDGQIDVELSGRIDTAPNGGLRTSFESVPDVPVSSFSLEMKGGPNGLLEISKDLCRFPKRFAVQMRGQNGASISSKPKLLTPCGSKRKAKRAHRAGKGS